MTATAATAPAPTSTATAAAAPAPAGPHYTPEQMFHHFSKSVMDWIGDYWLQILIAGIVAVAIAFALTAARRFGHRLIREEDARRNWLAIVGKAITKTTNYFIVMVAIRVVDNYAGTPGWLDKLVAFLFTIAAVIQCAIWAREIILGAIEHRTSSENFKGEAVMNAMGLIRLLVSFAVFAIAGVVLLDNLGVNVTGLVAGLGVGGIAIGLAAQGIFADLFAALAIIFDRPFGRGDAVTFDTFSGTVETIGMKSTRIRAYTGELMVIANKNLLEKTIFNVAGRDHIRLPFAIGVAYETPPETLARIPDMLKELVVAEGGTPSRAGFENFGASSLDYTLLVDVPGRDWSIAHPLRDRLVVSIVKRFAEEGIVFAYPTQTTYFNAPNGQPVTPWPQKSAALAAAASAAQTPEAKAD
ncbi:mechanosensitive ion channel family protein [Novosphingobium sp. 9]|uniref:mechanosensitive ion channel family protein n=1 Tax=Novosphingobium sp. 9 TaxID=2025349 RepID=UPI0021B52E91|nr:mechanosensitive ion channel family protein [Novosphingobium sp. 9]